MYETLLIRLEKLKWDALKSGNMSSLSETFADDYQSIGYFPDGSVRMTTKSQTLAAQNKLPPDINFVLSDFKVIFADKNSAVVTYLAEGPIKVHATSIWAKRGKRWQTIFYQATMIK